MKAMGLLLMASLGAFSTAQAGTIAAQALKCGGVATVSQTDTGSLYLDVSKVGTSTCQTVLIKNINYDMVLNGNSLRQFISLDAVGSQLVLVINNEEAVILDLSRATRVSAPVQSASVQQQQRTGMSEYERRQLEIEQRRDSREQARRNAEAAAAAGAAAGAVGGALIEGVGGLER